jgi:hypothetical protein
MQATTLSPSFSSERPIPNVRDLRVRRQERGQTCNRETVHAKNQICPQHHVTCKSPKHRHRVLIQLDRVLPLSLLGTSLAESLTLEESSVWLTLLGQSPDKKHYR